MNRIKRWWNSVSGKLTTGALQMNDVTARELCRMLQRCPVCGGEFTEHTYAHFAVTVFGDDVAARVKEFLAICEEHRWEEVQRFQEFDANRDALVAYAMRCSSGRLAALIERSPYETYESDRLIACDVLDDASGRQLEKLVAQTDWRKLIWT